jgi:hypothetical protein
MSKDEKGYNGWRNYETRIVNLWLDNDGYFEMLREDCKAPGKGVGKLADRIRKDMEERAEEITGQASMFADLIGAALHEVDWDEIAANHSEKKTCGDCRNFSDCAIEALQYGTELPTGRPACLQFDPWPCGQPDPFPFPEDSFYGPSDADPGL